MFTESRFPILHATIFNFLIHVTLFVITAYSIGSLITKEIQAVYNIYNDVRYRPARLKDAFTVKTFDERGRDFQGLVLKGYKKDRPFDWMIYITSETVAVDAVV